MEIENEKAEVETEMDIVRVKELPVSKAGFVICFQFTEYFGEQRNSFGEGEDIMWAILGDSSPFNITEVALQDKIVHGNGSSGLLLCYDHHNRHYLSLWNPAMDTLHRLPRCLKTEYFPLFDGFGFDPTTHSYVVVRGYDCEDPDDIELNITIPYSLHLHVYRFQSHSRKPKWKEIIIRRTKHNCHTPQNSAIFSKGVFYWTCHGHHVFAFKPPYNENSWEMIKYPGLPSGYSCVASSLTGFDGCLMLVNTGPMKFQMWQLTDEHQWLLICDLELSQFGKLDLNDFQVAMRPTRDFLVLSMSKRKLWLCNSVGTIMQVIDFTGKLPSQMPFNVCTFPFETTSCRVALHKKYDA